MNITYNIISSNIMMRMKMKKLMAMMKTVNNLAKATFLAQIRMMMRI